MHTLVSGSSGLIGSALLPLLTASGHRVTRLVRSTPAKHGEIAWNPTAGLLEPSSLEGLEAVVHLAGENIAAGRWTQETLRRIRESRVQGTTLLCKTLARLSRPPNVMICASATGYYGDRGEELLTEESEAGSGFLAALCREWEAAAEPARQKGIRLVHARFGVVLSAAGGALVKMLPPFQMGMGGRLGNGRQYMSWIAIDDVAGAIQHALVNDTVRGAVNVTAPAPATNREFTRALGRVLSRPTIFPVPAFALRLLFGQLADEALLASARVAPAKLLSSGYAFRYAGLEAALRHVLGRGKNA